MNTGVYTALLMPKWQIFISQVFPTPFTILLSSDPAKETQFQNKYYVVKQIKNPDIWRINVIFHINQRISA